MGVSERKHWDVSPGAMNLVIVCTVSCKLWTYNYLSLLDGLVIILSAITSHLRVAQVKYMYYACMNDGTIFIKY